MSLLLTVLAATAAISFSHITVEQGLSQNTVFSICQDRDGNMWFATNNGLNRYVNKSAFNSDPSPFTSVNTATGYFPVNETVVTNGAGASYTTKLWRSW